MEVFLDKEVSEAVPDKEGKRALWRNKKARDFMHFLIHKSTLLSTYGCFRASGFTPALLNVGSGRQMLEKRCRDGHRCVVDSPELTRYLFEILKPHLPSKVCVQNNQGKITAADRKSQVRHCLGFCTADFLSSLAYESAEQKPKHCLT